MDDDKDTEEPWREDRQRHQAGDPQTLFIRREDQDRAGWPDVIVFFKPDVDRNLGLFDAVEPRRISSFDT